MDNLYSVIIRLSSEQTLLDRGETPTLEPQLLKSMCRSVLELDPGETIASDLLVTLEKRFPTAPAAAWQRWSPQALLSSFRQRVRRRHEAQTMPSAAALDSQLLRIDRFYALAMRTSMIIAAEVLCLVWFLARDFRAVLIWPWAIATLAIHGLRMTAAFTWPCRRARARLGREFVAITGLVCVSMATIPSLLLILPDFLPSTSRLIAFMLVYSLVQAAPHVVRMIPWLGIATVLIPAPVMFYAAWHATPVLAVMTVPWLAWLLHIAWQQSTAWSQGLAYQTELEKERDTLETVLASIGGATGTWVFRTDVAFRLIDCSEALARGLKLAPAAAEQMKLIDLLTRQGVPPSSITTFKALDSLMDRREAIANLTLRVNEGTGIRQFVLNARPVRDKGGTFAGYKGTLCDVTFDDVCRSPAVKDTLTGLPVFSAIEGRIEAAIDRQAAGGGSHCAVVLIEPIHAEQIIRDQGSDAMARMLTAMAFTLRDNWPQGTIAALPRYRLMLFLDDVMTPEHLHQAMSAMRQRIAHTVAIEMDAGDVRIGIATSKTARGSTNVMIEQAQLALVAAQSKPGGVVLHAPSAMRFTSVDHLQFRLRAAIDHAILRIRYALILTADDQSVAGVLVSLSWDDPLIGPVDTDLLAAIADDDLRAPLSAYVKRTIAADLADLPPALRIDVPAWLLDLGDGRIDRRLHEVFALQGIADRQVGLMLAETASAEDISAALRLATQQHPLTASPAALQIHPLLAGQSLRLWYERPDDARQAATLGFWPGQVLVGGVVDNEQAKELALLGITHVTGLDAMRDLSAFELRKLLRSLAVMI